VLPDQMHVERCGFDPHTTGIRNYHRSSISEDTSAESDER
jgi:hypothetical protein